MTVIIIIQIIFFKNIQQSNRQRQVRQMTWYDKNLIPEWKVFIDKPYNIQSLLNHKDIILKEVSKTQQIQHYLKRNRTSIIQNGLMMCLQYPTVQSNYDRKYAFPTLAIELLTNQLIFFYLGWQKQSIKHYIHHLFKYFSTVNPHIDNVNLYHAYFQRLFRVMMDSKFIDKWTVINSIEEEDMQHGIIDHLFNHSHKYSVMLCLENILAIDFIQPLVCLNQNLKKKIITKIFQNIQEYSSKGYPQDGIINPKAQHMLTFLRFYLQRSIKFIIQYTINEQISKQHKNLITNQKLQHYLFIFQTYQSNFPLIYTTLTKTKDHQLKILIFEMLQIIQILYLKARRKQINFQIFIPYYEKIIIEMLKQKVNIYHNSFIDWLLIYFSQVGQSKFKTDLILNLKILPKLIQIIKDNKSKTIILTKIFQLLKIIFINIQKQIFLTIQHQKHNTSGIKIITFPLFQEYMSLICTLQLIVKQFKNINEMLFTFMFKLFKIIGQYGLNIQQIFQHYIQIQACKDGLGKIKKVIQFQREQPCFAVYQREIGKQLGNFYGEDVFVDLKPVQFKVKHNVKSNTIVNAKNVDIVAEQSQNFIKLPQTTTSMMKSQQIILQNPTEQSQNILEIKEKQIQTEQAQKRISISETLIQQPSQIISPQSKIMSSENISVPQTQSQNLNNQQDQKLRFNKFMKIKINQISTDFNVRRTQSKTPTKIKNQLKKAKNKWIQSPKDSCELQQNEKIPFNGQIKTERKAKSYSSPKLPKHLAECTYQKIQLIRVTKSKKPKIQKERQICKDRDHRLMNWLTMLRA